MKHLKSEFDKLTFKEILTYGLAVCSAVASVVGIFLSLYIPPVGEIHASVLTYFGISCGFVAALLGISIHYSNELSKFKRSVGEEIAQHLKDLHAPSESR